MKTKRYFFENNFDLSVILPFYKKLDVFKVTLQHNHVYFQRNGIEVIIVMDEPSEQDGLLRLIKTFPLINWKVIVNETPHEWRNPSKAINVGIRAASKKYILVMGPDSEFATDVIYSMRQMAEYYDKCFFVGRVAFVDYSYAYSRSSIKEFVLPYYGSILVKKEYLIAINGYDEGYDKWGGDDDNIRARLERYGLKKLKLPLCILLHREPTGDLLNSRKKEKLPTANREIEELKRSFTPQHYFANPLLSFGYDFSKIIYDWSNNTHSKEICVSYLERNDLDIYELKEAAFNQEYKVIALLSVYNESRHFPDLLVHLKDVCDGIILLDDASEDGTYERVSGEKLLLKVKKKHRKNFNDLVNRNTLLDIASFFKSEFFFFIDADERLDPRYCNLRAVAASNKDDAYQFNLVHLWNDENSYRIDVPEISQVHQPGLLQRWRMFKNIGRMNIAGDRLHFEATPYKMAKATIAPILIKHYGLIDPEIRSMKHKRYLVEDEKLYLKPEKYDYFLEEQVVTGPVSEIILPSI